MAVRLPILDRLFNRAQRRSAGSYVRRFDGATGGRRGFGMGHFGSINPEVGTAAATLRSRARHMAANNSFVGNGIANWVAALVGAGIMPAPRHPDAATRNLVSSVFLEWADRADADQRTDFFGLLATIVRAMIVDGESFVQILDGDSGPEIRVIPAELVDESKTADGLSGGGYVVSGVEFDADGRRVAYWVLPSKPTDVFSTYAPPVRIPAEDILHVFKPMAPGQVRGISWLAPVVLPASELDKLVDALLTGANVAAMHSGFITDMNGTGTIPYDGDQRGNVMESGLEPGTLKILPAGFDIKFNTPQQANEVAAFLRFNLQQLAAGLGLPEHLLSGDLTNANYSSLRAGLLPFRQRVEQVQYHTLVPQLLNPVWSRVITFGVLSGEIDAPDFETNFRAYGAEWLPPRLMQVDPAKDAQALREMLAMGLMSRRQAVAEQGWSVDDLDAEISADREREKALGLDFSTAPKDKANGPDTP
jgi:lambda family phage portal protein